MTEHYSGHDPETGCALMLLLGIAMVIALVGIVLAVLSRLA